MVSHEHILIAGSTYKGLLLLLMLLPQMNFNNWLEEFKIIYDQSKHSDIKYVFTEYDSLTKKLTSDLTNKNEPLKDTTENSVNGSYLSPFEIYQQIEGYKIRLMKLKIMSDRELHVTYNLNKSTGVKYIVVRSNWIDMKTGKKYRKFSKNLGSEDKVLVNKVIPQYLMKETLVEITRMMWDQYKLEYPD